jgi:hypothetical protein
VALLFSVVSVVIIIMIMIIVEASGTEVTRYMREDSPDAGG